MSSTIQVQLLRHATLVVTIAGQRLLVDPMLSPRGAMDPVPNSAPAIRFPMIDLPLDADALTQLLAGIDAVMITHTHRDHFDAEAMRRLPKSRPVFCQPGDAEKVQQAGFTDVTEVTDFVNWRGLRISRTDGQHGTGEIGRQMGKVSGFVLQSSGLPSLYIAGDTIWCGEVATALAEYQPDVVVVNAGAAQFLVGDPITMTAEDVARVAAEATGARVVAVHMDTVNHCGLTRVALRTYLRNNGLEERVLVPADGEELQLSGREPEQRG